MPQNFDSASRALLNALDDAVVVVDAQGIVLAANSAAKKVYLADAKEPASLEGRHLRDILPRELAQSRMENVTLAMADNMVHDFEDEDETRAWQHSVRPLQDGIPVTAYVLVSKDVTSDRMQDIELRREQQRHIFYLESLPGYVMLVRWDHVIVYVNRRFRQLFGRPGKRKCHEVMGDPHGLCGHCPIQPMLEDMQPRQWEWQHPDGRIFEVYSHPMTGEDRSAQFLVLGIEITARKTAERALVKAQEYQKAILDNIPDLVWLKDDHNRFVALNQAYAAACGKNADSLSGKNEIDAWGAVQGEKFLQRDAMVLTTRRRMTEEEHIEDEQHNSRWLEAVRVPIFDAQGKLLGLTGIARDITERKQTVERLRYSHAEMERHVHERTSELRMAVEQLEREVEERKRTEEALVQARQRAEVATRAKSIFLANMSHEIRTPLNVIMTMTDVALRRNSMIDQGRALEMVHEAGSTLLSVINDILDFSKIEARKMKLEVIDFNLHKTLGSIFRIHSVQATRKGLDAFLDVHPKTGMFVKGDPGRLAQVLGNLLANAVKFTSSGSVRLEVRPVSPPEGTGKDFLENGAQWVRFAVSDTGIGIAKDKQQLIFESFQQADDATTREFGGTGLGLTISKQLVELMHGKMSVESQEGWGSTFSFCLPIARGDESAVRKAEEDLLVGDLPELEPMRILLAEDNALNRELIVSLLRKQGHTVLETTNGHDALAILAKEKVDVVLMDIQMPMLDGVATTKAIRKAEDLAVPNDVPVIALTAHALDGDRDRFLDVGMDGYVSKPIGLNELMREMYRIMKDKIINNALAAAGQEIVAAREAKGEQRRIGRGSEPFVDVHAPPQGLDERSDALERLQGDEALMRNLDKHFIHDAPKDMRKLSLALETDDFATVKMIAHRIKGQTGTIGAGRAFSLARWIEGAAMAEERAQLQEMIDALQAEVGCVIEHMEALPPLDENRDSAD